MPEIAAPDEAGAALSAPPADPVDVLLVSMPFGPLLEPSLGLSLLKAVLVENGLRAKILYLTLPFAKKVGIELYSAIAAGAPHSTTLVGEWIFSGEFEEPGPAPDAYIKDILLGGSDPHPVFVTSRAPATEDFISGVLRARAGVVDFLADATRLVLETGAPVVGFTSVFQQNVASLALARRVKDAKPGTTILFGGANCEGEMGRELVRQFQFIDAAVSGEGENAIVRLTRNALDRSKLPRMPGVHIQGLQRADGEPERAGTFEIAPLLRPLDSLPYPAYDDFFEQLRHAGLGNTPGQRLLFESARGCWWGEKHHCTFCGLNGSTLTFRSKSADRALDELRKLAEAYPGVPISVVDNILDMSYFRDLLPVLRSEGLETELFFEVKANLKREQVQLLREAGVSSIQPGIESLSTPILGQMRKGVTALQNIQLLKWCEELGVTPHWNVLWGFPGEDPREYAKMAELMPLLHHLGPPTGGALIRLDRFSPHHADHASFGFRNVRPFPAYSYVYPSLGPESLSRLAYFFSFEYALEQDVARYVASVAEQIDQWRGHHEDSALFYIDKGDRTVVCDFRGVAENELVVLDGLARFVLLGCREIATAKRVVRRLDEEGVETDIAAVEAVLHALRDRRLVVAEQDKWLSLPISIEDRSPGPAAIQRFLDLIGDAGVKRGSTTVLSADRVSDARVG